VQRIEFAGAAKARAQPAALATLARADLRAVVICPSNPFVSIEPILSLPGMRAALQACTAPVIAVTPIIGGQAVKGPAAKMLRELGHEVSGAAVARRYTGLIDAFILDRTDATAAAIPGISLYPAATLMLSTEDREQLARAVLAVADAFER
jgi:LPPG:FO 2-phospho-L-lactate transferase